MTRRDRPGGTVTHIPPENWRDINTLPTEQYDVYSFGILLWELLSENHPFHAGKFCFAHGAQRLCRNPFILDK